MISGFFDPTLALYQRTPAVKSLQPAFLAATFGEGVESVQTEAKPEVKSTEAEQPVIILVRPQMGENIGAAARAMLNFGLSELRLVAPRDGWPNPAAEAMAAGADGILARARVHASLAEALSDLTSVWATTARRRELALPVSSPVQAVPLMRTHLQTGGKVGVLFGAERTGLETAEVALANAILTYPVNPAFASLNIAQAVGVFAYAWQAEANLPSSWLENNVEARSGSLDLTPASRAEVEGLVAHLTEELSAVGFFFPDHRVEQMQRNLRVALQRAAFTQPEVQTLRGAVKALVNGPRRRAQKRALSDKPDA
jgi:tRNA/rRNA methyltransferase